MIFIPFIKRIQIHRPIKYAWLLGAILIGSNLLSGCANVMQHLGYTPISAQTTQSCAAAPVLITNLTTDVHRRQYQLPDGRQCPEVNHYEQDKLRAEKAAKKWW